MVSAMMVAVGSRGDAEPCFASAKAMLQSGKFHRIDICIQPEYTHLVPTDKRIHVHEFSFTTANFSRIFYYEYFKDSIISFFTRKYDSTRPSRRCIASIIKRFLVPELSCLYQVASVTNPSVLMATTLAGPVTFTIAQQLKKPLWLINFQPTTPTMAYPYYMSGHKTARLAGNNVVEMFSNSCRVPENKENIESYTVQQEIHRSSLYGINNYRSICGLPSLDMTDVCALFSGYMENAYVLNAFSSQLIPRSLDWSAGVHQVPPLADDYIPSGWRPEEKCPELKQYLSTASQPVCVSFGSMNVAEKKSVVTRELFTALRSSGIHEIILLKGSSDLGAHNLSEGDSNLKRWAADHVFFSDEPAQLAWLLPRCSALICHGGAGTTFAGLRAGIPVIIAPLFCDQFFWGHVIQGLQLGSVVEPNLRDATAETFQVAFKNALEARIREKVSQYSRNEDSMGGSMAAAELFSKSISTSLPT